MGTHLKDPLTWLHGIIAAFLAGGASAAASGISAMVIAPDKFNVGANLGNTLKLIGTSFVISGLFGVFQRLSKSPLPEIVDDGTK
jgi:hypothetical protein